MQIEANVRVALCRRASGTPVLGKHTYYIKSKKYEVTTVQCLYGICEICHERKETLEPHEQVFKSHGGKISLSNSLMVCRPCHEKAQRNSPIWTIK